MGDAGQLWPWIQSESASSASSTTWNLAAESALGSAVDMMGEIYGNDRAKPWLGAGLSWAASDTLSLNASYSVQTESPRVKLDTVGFKLAF